MAKKHAVDLNLNTEAAAEAVNGLIPGELDTLALVSGFSVPALVQSEAVTSSALRTPPRARASASPGAQLLLDRRERRPAKSATSEMPDPSRVKTYSARLRSSASGRCDREFQISKASVVPPGVVRLQDAPLTRKAREAL
ncbi:hypothetical protein [Nocardioides marmoraquaticus]